MQNTFDRVVRPLYGHYCWGFNFDPLFNLSFQIGPPKLKIREPRKTTSKNPDIIWLYSIRQVDPYGKWEFYTRSAYWKIRQNNITTTRSSSKKQILEATASLSGQVLQSFQIKIETGSTQINFDLGGILEIRRCTKVNRKILWDLFLPDDTAFSVLSDGSFELENTKGTLIDSGKIQKQRDN